MERIISNGKAFIPHAIVYFPHTGRTFVVDCNNFTMETLGKPETRELVTNIMVTDSQQMIPGYHWGTRNLDDYPKWMITEFRRTEP